MSQVSILIPARNADATIARAIASVRSQTAAPLIVVDDFSTDRTVEVAKDVGGQTLRVVRPRGRGTVASVRMLALAETRTPFAVWLDADDELLPGRVDRLVQVLEAEGSDFAWDAAELVTDADDGPTIAVPIPDFLIRDPQPVRLFERNYLPAPGTPGVRVRAALRVGYDPTFAAAEDIDLMLRAVAEGAPISLVSETGYRIISRAGSLSRHLDHQRAWYRRALAKHPYERIRALYLDTGHLPEIAAWALVSVALFRQDWKRATHWLIEVRGLCPDPDTVIESDGPCPWSEGWRQAFTAGTLALLTDDMPEAIDWLDRAESARPSAEGLNNLGVAHTRLGQTGRALECFEKALALRPGYADARLNLDGSSPPRITTHPFRHEPSRADYSVRDVGRLP